MLFRYVLDQFEAGKRRIRIPGGVGLWTNTISLSFIGLLIIKNTDSLLSLIDDVDFKLDNFIRETERSFKNVNNDIEDLSDEVRTNIRRTKQKLADLEQSRDQLSKDLKEVRALPSIIKGIQKMKEEAAKAAAEDD